MPNPTIIPLARIRRMKPCPRDLEILERLYPDGIPLTYKDALRIRRAEGDVLWGLLHLLRKKQRQQFVLFALRQQQPMVVRELRDEGCDEIAEVVRSLQFSTPAQAAVGVRVLGTIISVNRVSVSLMRQDAAAVAVAGCEDAAIVEATSDRARRRQIKWCVEELTK